jgi:pimeloyl-ACP methyl ester carboxylesterase
MPVQNIRGVNIDYDVLGDQGPWLSLMTGGRRARGEFVSLAKKIAGKGFRVLLHDRRNTGASDISLEGTGNETEEELWTDDLHALLKQLGAAPAFISGSSSGARTSMLFYFRHPEAVRALILMRVTGGPSPAKRLPEQYYGQFIKAAERGGMAEVCKTGHYPLAIQAKPKNRDTLMAMDPKRYLAVMKRWHEAFLAGVHHPVMGVSNEQLASIKVPTLVIPGNDETHASASGKAAAAGIPGAKLHQLPVEDQQVTLIEFAEWAHLEDEIAEAYAKFMNEVASRR